MDWVFTRSKRRNCWLTFAALRIDSPIAIHSRLWGPRSRKNATASTGICYTAGTGPNDKRADHLLVWLSAFSYYEQSIPYGIRLFRYHRGFLHQKVMLIDERLAAVGTANLDNRSFRLNFEITAFSTDPRFVGQVTEMLTEDFKHAREAEVGDFTGKSFLFRAACRAARLFAPVQ